MAEKPRSPITRVRKKNPARKKEYQEKHHSLRLEKDVWEIWQAQKSSSGLKTHDEFALALLNKWRSEHTGEVMEEPPQETTPLKFDRPSTSHAAAMSTPLEFHRTAVPVIEGISDISEGSESESNGKVLDRYAKKAEEVEKSFIEISLDYGDHGTDTTYSPESDDESDLDEEDCSDLDNFELEMSLFLEDKIQNFDDLPIQGSFERDSFMESESSDEETYSGEDEEVEGDDDQTAEESRNLVTEKKFIAFEKNLIELAEIPVVKFCTGRNCKEPITIRLHSRGTGIQLKWICRNGHVLRQWCSQPTIKRRLAGDVLLSTCILTSGNNYDKIKLLFTFFGMGLTARTAHYQIQGKHTVPVVNESFQEMLNENRQKYTDQTITIAADGRMDSPGHSAQYCTYTILEYNSKDIVAMEIIDKRMTGMKSTNMEKEGLTRALSALDDNKITVGELVTDASTTIAAMIRKDHPLVNHTFDTWHGAKNFGKRIAAVAAEKRNKDLRPWVSDLINHFWYCSKVAESDESKMLAVWRGVLHHVVDVHTWGLGDGGSHAQCNHGELDRSTESKWLEPGGDAHMALTRVVLDTGLLHSLKHYVNFRHTGELENFHESLLMYCAKRYAYSYPIYKARNMLAALDYQYHKERPTLVTRTGEPRLHRVWSKRSANWTAYEVKQTKQYTYIPALHERVLKRFCESNEPLSTKMEWSPSDPRHIKRTLADVSPPQTKQLFAQKKSRFETK